MVLIGRYIFNFKSKNEVKATIDYVQYGAFL